jgi:hypothetical protein
VPRYTPPRNVRLALQAGTRLRRKKWNSLTRERRCGVVVSQSISPLAWMVSVLVCPRAEPGQVDFIGYDLGRLNLPSYYPQDAGLALIDVEANRWIQSPDAACHILDAARWTMLSDASLPHTIRIDNFRCRDLFAQCGARRARADRTPCPKSQGRLLSLASNCRSRRVRSMPRRNRT